MTLLDVKNLKTYYTEDDGGQVRATDDVSFSLEPGETLGLVGESGSGKTTIARSILRLLPDNGRIVDGSINFNGTDITELSKKEMNRQIRWSEISMIPQNAMNAFDPVYTVGEQIVEVIKVHENDTTKQEAIERGRILFEELGIDPDRIHDYPHQFSGGMAQRAMIALALTLNPSLILADEPTTALDVVIQDRILDTIKDMQEDIGSAMILITHDMSVVSETCDRIAVCYGGRIVEIADTETIITNPRHPYTLGLGNAFPDISMNDQELISIPGTPPNLVDPGEGCRFAPRCPYETEECWDITPPSETVQENHKVECHRAEEYEYIQSTAGDPETWDQVSETDSSLAETDSSLATTGGDDD